MHCEGRLLEETTNTGTCTMEDVGKIAAAGAVVGVALVAGTFLAVGLTPFVGPYAGG
jgi:hypothetical protein